MPKPEYLTATQVARLLGISRQACHARLIRGTLDGVRYGGKGPGSVWMVSRTSAEEALARKLAGTGLISLRSIPSRE